MRFLIENGIKYPELEGTALPLGSFSDNLKVMWCVSGMEVFFGVIGSVIYKNTDVMILTGLLWLFMAALLLYVHWVGDRYMKMRYRIENGLLTSATARSSCTVDLRKNHYISKIVHRAGGRNPWNMPCYAFSNDSINPLLGTDNGSGFEGVELLQKRGIGFLPESEEINAWIEERYGIENIPEFPHSCFCRADAASEIADADV